MTNGYVFREYIGAQSTGVHFSDVPVSPNVFFHFILAFAIDYLTSQSSPPQPANGVFAPFWDTANLTPYAAAKAKADHSNMSIMVGLGGDTVQNTGVNATFAPTSVNSWVANAVQSVSNIITTNSLDGVDVAYEHFEADVHTFVECIGRLLTQLKARFPNITTSIAPFEDPVIQMYYQQLWYKYSGVIDYVSFQFYRYGANTNVAQYVQYYNNQLANYPGGTVLASLQTGNVTGVVPPDVCIDAAKELQQQGMLPGVFIWSADRSYLSSYGQT